jgi:hypothetical protein
MRLFEANRPWHPSVPGKTLYEVRTIILQKSGNLPNNGPLEKRGCEMTASHVAFGKDITSLADQS